VGTTTLLTALLATALALIHLFAAKMRFLNVTPRSVWLGAAVLETDGSVTIIPGTDLSSTSALTSIAGWRPDQKRAPGANTRTHPKQG
jgi:hypothetical protein